MATPGHPRGGERPDRKNLVDKRMQRLSVTPTPNEHEAEGKDDVSIA